MRYIATALATYVTTGEIPKASLSIDPSTISVRLGILSYSHGEKVGGKVMVTPNTHQPYVIVTLPELSVKIDQVLKENTVPASQVEIAPTPFASGDLLW